MVLPAPVTGRVAGGVVTGGVTFGSSFGGSCGGTTGFLTLITASSQSCCLLSLTLLSPSTQAVFLTEPSCCLVTLRVYSNFLLSPGLRTPMFSVRVRLAGSLASSTPTGNVSLITVYQRSFHSLDAGGATFLTVITYLMVSPGLVATAAASVLASAKALLVVTFCTSFIISALGCHANAVPVKPPIINALVTTEAANARYTFFINNSSEILALTPDNLT